MLGNFKANLSPYRRYGAIIVTSIICSFGGIFVGAYITKPDDGGKGGAIAVAIALFVLFVRDDYGARVQAVINELPERKARLKALMEGKEYVPPQKELEALVTKIEGLEMRVTVDTKNQERQDLAIGIVSFIGTLVWAFGDIAAYWLKHLHH